ncbi:MAG: S8 family serine peptidase, partial [Promethearchaeota archaeon]
MTFFVDVDKSNTNTTYGETSSTNSNVIDKLGYNLQFLLKNSTNYESYPVQIIIIFKNKIIIEDIITKIKAISFTIQIIREWRFISAAVFNTPIKYIEKIAHFPEVKSIWLDQKFSIPEFHKNQLDEGYISDIISSDNDSSICTKNSENYDNIYNGTNVIVALLDTGVDIYHPDLNNSLLAFGGVSMVEADPFPLDFHGHGTFSAGVITGDGVINSNFKGVAPGTEILNIKVLSYLGVGLWSWIISGIEYAITHGADIISMCFSMPGYSGDPIDLAINTAIKRGMIVVTAAGDDGPAYSSVTAPGIAQGAITVGAFNDLTQQPASFSGRGSTLSFHVKPDILASGVNIISCRPTTPSNLPINLTEFFQGTISYGLPLNDDYTIVNSTSAAAANITGVIASLLQHSKFLSPEEVKIILQKTANQLQGVPINIQGAGLVNANAAHSYLVQNKLNNSITENRLYTPSLFSPGYVVSKNSTRSITAFISNYGSLLAIFESRQSNLFTHMIQGQLAVKYNNSVIWLSDMYILRELHNMTSEFSFIQAIITDYKLLCVFSLKAWPSIDAFCIDFTLINLEPTSIQNISLFSLWDTNLFYNQSDQASNDIPMYNFIDDIIYVNDSYNGTSSYIGFTGINHSKTHEINTSSHIRNQIKKGFLLNNDNSLQNNSIAMEWNLTSKLNGSEFIHFTQYIGIGTSYQALNDSINSIKTLQSSVNITNLVLLSSNLSRIGIVNQPYVSKVLLINLGNVAVNNIFANFLINSTDLETQTFFSKLIYLDRLEPYEFRWVTASWNPIEADIYSAYWIAGSASLINEIILYLMNISQKITQEQNFWDNFFIRNIFIKEISLKMHNLFPNTIPISPQLIYFP